MQLTQLNSTKHCLAQQSKITYNRSNLALATQRRRQVNKTNTTDKTTANGVPMNTFYCNSTANNYVNNFCHIFRQDFPSNAFRWKISIKKSWISWPWDPVIYSWSYQLRINMSLFMFTNRIVKTEKIVTSHSKFTL